ncbi:MAG: 5,10-methylenetetrahydromethanopterin reductase, partial [Actinomycetota bacterium]|nr:5,10-methylenetetrahydromethanopterin reductase [Actinomycetota bacterium]
RSVARHAAASEAAGWDGFAVVDSQNLTADCWVGLAIAAAATTTIGLGTAVTNPVTRLPAITASAAASVHIASGGRVTIGIGRGDSALSHLGRAPASVAALERYLKVLQAYLRREEVDFADLGLGTETAPDVDALHLKDRATTSRVQIVPEDLPKVIVEVSSTGPKVIEAAARIADRVMLAVGADPSRVRWGVEMARAANPDVRIGAFVNCVAHDDLDVARELIRGGLSTFTRFSTMHGTPTGPVDDVERETMAKLIETYDMTQHTQAGSRQAATLSTEFIDRFGVVGPPEACADRLNELTAMGLDKLIIVGPSLAAGREDALRAMARFPAEVLPRIS